MISERTRRRPRLLGAAALAAAAVGLPLLSAPDAAVAAPDDLGSRFTLAVLPDTQFYSRYSASQFLPRYGDDPFHVQTQWLAEHADELNVPFVTHVGDVVDQVGQAGEWQAADRAMRVLDDARLPYSITTGNHDVLDSRDTRFDTSYDLAAEPYLKTFPASRAAAQPTVENGTDPTGLSRFHVFEAEGQRFLSLALPWRASDETLAWADQVIADHPTLPTILTSHEVINIASDGTTAVDTAYGERLWDRLIAPNDQVFLTFNGHFHGSTWKNRTNDAGHGVTQVLIDHQMDYEGGDGYLGLVEFDLTNGTLEMQTASPWVTWKPSETLTAYDQPLLDAPNQRYTVPVDFRTRFAGFAPDFRPGSADEPPLVERARALLLDGFEGAPPVTTEAPGGRADHTVVDGTLAWWRPGEEEAGVVAPGESVADVVGDADLTRLTNAESGSPGAEAGDVTIERDAHPLSSDGASLCFANADKAAKRFSALTSPGGTAVDEATFPDGYTIETFLRVDPSWTDSANSWSKAIVRSGNRSQIGVPQTRWDWTASPAALGISNLKEFQWTEVTADPSKGDRTAWSGEIIPGRWLHVALVNDVDAATTTMYVDGAPVLRNATDTGGQTIQHGMPWLFGSDWVDDAATNGWNGCIGETRVVDHPIGAASWLTARADLDDLSVDDGAGDAPTVTVTGTGRPGATVAIRGDVAGTAAVGADGRWSADVRAAAGRSVAVTALAAGRAEAVQSIGTRSGTAVPFAVVLPAAAEPGDGGSSPAPGDDADPAGPDAPADGAPVAGDGTADPVDDASAGRDGGELAFTGAAGLGVLGALTALLLVAGGVLLVVRRRRRADGDGERAELS
ncbi:metallophosphoesterase [Curtobacterium sp. 22159]|uniref:metallophosphoesterase n=1 Tax=Curtobacterium sp. 22159 TaxID=3453882 RepID=UPI003F8300B4